MQNLPPLGDLGGGGKLRGMIEAGMTHYDEHTLELYLLNSSLVAGERGAIAAHLDVCRGCSGIVDELRDFHAGLAEELQHRPVESPESENSLVRRSRQIEKYFEPFSSAAPYRPRGAARIVSIVRH